MRQSVRLSEGQLCLLISNIRDDTLLSEEKKAVMMAQVLRRGRPVKEIAKAMERHRDSES